jgi:hypothetical protein
LPAANWSVGHAAAGPNEAACPISRAADVGDMTFSAWPHGAESVALDVRNDIQAGLAKEAISA